MIGWRSLKKYLTSPKEIILKTLPIQLMPRCKLSFKMSSQLITVNHRLEKEGLLHWIQILKKRILWMSRGT